MYNTEECIIFYVTICAKGKNRETYGVRNLGSGFLCRTVVAGSSLPREALGVLVIVS